MNDIVTDTDNASQFRDIYVITSYDDAGLLAEHQIVEQPVDLHATYDRMRLAYARTLTYSVMVATDSPDVYAADLNHVTRTVQAVGGRPYDVAHRILRTRIEATRIAEWPRRDGDDS